MPRVQWIELTEEQWLHRYTRAELRAIADRVDCPPGRGARDTARNLVERGTRLWVFRASVS